MNKVKTAREVALEVLTRVDKDKSYSNLQLNQALKKEELSRADANFVTEILYGTIQHLNTIDWIIIPFINLKMEKLEPWVKNLLRISVYQLWYLDKVPTHAIVNEAVNIANKKGHKGISGMVNGILRNIIRKKEKITIPKDLPEEEKIALEHSHPIWLVNRLKRDYGLEETKEICRVNNLAPFHSVRINPLKTSRDEMIHRLKQELGNQSEIVPSPLSNQGIRVKGGGNLAFTSWYKEGYITIQDESSMLVAHALDPKPNMNVLDAAAAPGGKTTHLAELMNDKGLIIASDIHRHKIKLIDDQQTRLGLHIINTIHSDARALRNVLEPTFDRILLDVPCSGLGVIRRKPDLKWTKTEEDIKNLASVQKEILNTVSSLLKPGGILVYSTCTMAIDENQEMIKWFIQEHPDFQLDPLLSELLPDAVSEKINASQGMVQILPHHFHTDGFFISRLKKLG